MLRTSPLSSLLGAFPFFRQAAGAQDSPPRRRNRRAAARAGAPNTHPTLTPAQLHAAIAAANLRLDRCGHPGLRFHAGPRNKPGIVLLVDLASGSVLRQPSLAVMLSIANDNAPLSGILVNKVA